MLEFFLYLVSGIGYGLYFDLNLVETAIVGILLVCVFRGWTPRFSLKPAWTAWTRFAYRRKIAVTAVFFSALAIRAALLPLLPVPKPMVTDEFSHLLLADTLTHGRLTNRTHPMWVHFETIHVIQQPTYNSDYFPGQAAILALGKLAGHPWIAVWLLSAAMCAAICWMLQAWVPPQWALFGAAIAVIRFDIASYWVNGYYGGALAALGGALALGAYPRLTAKPGLGMSLLLGLGLTIIGYSRPYEGLAVALCIAAGLLFALRKRKIGLLHCVPAASLALVGIAGLLIYCRAVTGDPLRTPYAANQAAYGWPMVLPWYQPTQPQFRHIELRRYYDYELDAHERNASLFGELKMSTLKAQETWRFYFGPALSVPLVMLPLVWRSRRLRLVLLAAGFTVLAALIESVNSPHYTAIATACFLALQVECFRRLRAYRRNRRPVGTQLLFSLPAVLMVILAVRFGLQASHLPFTQTINYQSWCCVQPGNPSKWRILPQIEQSGGRHLVLVKPKTNPDNLFQWIYNDADIDNSRIIWARDMGTEGNRALLQYFAGRKVWLVDPNVVPASITLLGP